MVSNLEAAMFRQFAISVCVCLHLTEAFFCGPNVSAADVVNGHDMTGKTVLITGGDSGIGYETALALARVNASIIIANRNQIHGQAAAASITRLTGNHLVQAVQVDLASFNSVRAASSVVLANHSTIDVLISDASVSGIRTLTEDGFDMVFQVNYLSHFLLEQLLLPALRTSPNGKVIHLGAGSGTSAKWFKACESAGLSQTCLDDLGSLVAEAILASPPGNNYAMSKFMLLYNGRELSMREAARGSSVRGYTARPGGVNTPTSTIDPALARKLCAPPICYNGFNGTSCAMCPMSEEAGASSPTFLAVSDLHIYEAGAEFFLCEPEEPPPWTSGNQQRLYNMSLQYVQQTSSIP